MHTNLVVQRDASDRKASTSRQPHFSSCDLCHIFPLAHFFSLTFPCDKLNRLRIILDFDPDFKRYGIKLIATCTKYSRQTPNALPHIALSTHSVLHPWRIRIYIRTPRYVSLLRIDTCFSLVRGFSETTYHLRWQSYCGTDFVTCLVVSEAKFYLDWGNFAFVIR